MHGIKHDRTYRQKRNGRKAISPDVHETNATAKFQPWNRKYQGRRFADRRPSVGDSGGSSSTNRTLVPTELRRPVRGRLEDAVRGAVVVPARSRRLANGVRMGVAGVVEI